jgi:LysR family transcriptional regulator for metE and metH
MASRHPRAGEPYLTAGAFREETLLCHYAEPGRGVLEEEFLASAGVQPARTLEMLVTPAVLEMARAGYGIAVVPRWILRAQGSLEDLVVLPLGEQGLWRTWYAASDATRRNEPVLVTLTQALHEQLRQDGGGVPEGARIRLA